MKLTFKTKGNIEIDYRVWLDNSEKEVEKATIMVIDRYSDLVVDKYSVQEKIMNNKKEYLAAIMISGLPSDNEICENIKTLVYESIHEHGDFVDSSQLHNKLNDKFWGIMDVDFYYDYKSTHCEVNLER